jgi:hypothetical protein
MSATQSPDAMAVPPARTQGAALSLSPQPKKKYDYVRVRLCPPGGGITTISLDRKLVEDAAGVLGSEQKVREVARAAAIEYIEGQSAARTRSEFAARALLRVMPQDYGR